MNAVWMVRWVMVINFMTASFAYGNEAQNISSALLQRVNTQLSELKQASFPELSHVQLEIQAIQNPAVFLATDIKLPALFTGRRQYVLYVNPQLETAAISDIALRGILAHELVHFLDYEQMNLAELAWFYAQYLMQDDYVAAYERNTDLHAFELGYALGIKHFRFWLYGQISEDAKVIKEKNYYTPEQIDNWLLDNLNPGDVTIL